MRTRKSEGRGCVREKLIQAGIELLASDDGEGLTLRRIAALAGVSHAAPAHYFEGLPGLRAAIAERGFEMLTKALQTGHDQAENDNFARLEAVSDSYIEFAETHTGLFRLMFDEVLTPPGPALRQKAHESYSVLRQSCAPFAQSGKGDRFEIMAWSMMHGYSALQMNRPRAPSAPFTPPKFSCILKLLVKANAAT